MLLRALRYWEKNCHCSTSFKNMSFFFFLFIYEIQVSQFINLEDVYYSLLVFKKSTKFSYLLKFPQSLISKIFKLVITLLKYFVF